MAPQARRILEALLTYMSLRKTRIHRLPIEVEYQVLGFLLDELDVNNTTMVERRNSVQPMLRLLACICRAWCSFVTPVLYRNIFISSPCALASLAASITTYPHLQPLVRSFQYCSAMYRYGRNEISKAEAINLERVYTFCTNLSSETVQRSSQQSQNFHNKALEKITLLSGSVNLTRLEIVLPFKGMVLPPHLTLASLQELVLHLQKDQASSTFSSRIEQWPHMPQLMRLCIKNKSYECLRFHLPQGSDKLRIIELLGGESETIGKIFETELWRLGGTLESLTITASCPWNHRGFLDLAHFCHLSELCCPISEFSTLEDCSLPDSLRYLILVGLPSDELITALALLYFDGAKKNLRELFELKAEGLAVRSLTLVRIMTKIVPGYFGELAEPARAAQVDLIYPQEESVGKENLWKRITNTRRRFGYP